MAASVLDHRSPPRAALLAAAAAVVGALGLTFWARTPPTPAPTADAVESRRLVIVNGAVGFSTVSDARDGAVLKLVRPGPEDGFIWGAVNALSYGRKLAGGAIDAPYELVRHADGRLTLADTATGQWVLLNAFGKGNTAAFARLLDTTETGK